MAVNLAVRKRQTLGIIDQDVWDATVTQRGVHPDDAVITLTIRCRIQPANQFRGAERPSSVGAERVVGHFPWMALAEWDCSQPHVDATLVAIQRASGLSHTYHVGLVARFAYKTEIYLDEVQ
jgi:hypothetical protein